MFSSNQSESLMKKILQQGNLNNMCNDHLNKEKHFNKNIGFTPAQISVIFGLLTGALSVNSVLVDRNQAVEIVLTGSLKRKTELDNILDVIGSMPFDEVLKAMMGRL